MLPFALNLQVIIQEKCKATGEVICTDYYCTEGGKCTHGGTPGRTSGSGTTTNPPPSVELITENGSLPQAITVPQGYDYTICATNQVRD